MAKKRSTLHLKGNTVHNRTSQQGSNVVELPTSQQKAAQEAATQAAESARAAMLQAAQEQVSFKVLAPFVSCLVEPHQLEQALASSYSEIYIHANGEFYKHMKLSGGRYVRMKVKGLPDRFKALEKQLKGDIKEELNFLPAGKIPFEYWQQIVAFFRQVMVHKKSDVEAHAWILWSEQRGYFISVPKQVVSKASVAFSYDADALPPGAVIVVDIHSHNTMGAFYSGTDDNNDKNSIYYSGVIGKISDKNYEYVMRFNLHDIKKTVDLDDVFDLTQSVEVPTDWMNQIQIQTAQAPTTTPAMGKWIGRQSAQEQERGKGKGKSTGGDNQQNPSKWIFPDSSNTAGGEVTGNSFRDSGSLWDNLGNTGSGSTGVGQPDPAYDAERGVFRGNAPRNDKQRAELEELLKGVPSGETPEEAEKRLDAQAEVWLKRHGYDSNGNDVLTNAKDESEVTAEADIPENFEGNTGFVNFVNSRDTAQVSGDDDEGDPVGSRVHMQDDRIHSGMYEAIEEMFGVDAADAYDDIDSAIVHLENCDAPLLDIIRQAYNMMSKDGQAELQTKGL